MGIVFVWACAVAGSSPAQAGCGPAIWLSSCGVPEDAVEREETKLEEIFREVGFL